LGVGNSADERPLALLIPELQVNGILAIPLSAPSDADQGPGPGLALQFLQKVGRIPDRLAVYVPYNVPRPQARLPEQGAARDSHHPDAPVGFQGRESLVLDLAFERGRGETSAILPLSRSLFPEGL